ncbi:MAG TPA: TSUP family transporter, partial [Herpetosiphonaceae bacterium]
LVIAGLMLRGGITSNRATPAPTTWWRVVLGGVGVGFLTGFLGVGGGFLIVPALVLLLGMEMPDAIGSSLVVIALNSAAGLLGHLSDGPLPWALIALVVLAGLAGLLLGARATQVLSPARIRQSFALFVLALAVALLVINVPAVMPA